MTDTGSIDLLTRLLDFTQSIELSLGLWLLGSALVAVVLYAAASYIIARLVAAKAPGRRTLQLSRGPLRLLAILTGLWIALPVGDFAPEIAGLARHGLRIGMVILTGWFVLITINALAFYFGSWHDIGKADNLEARRFHTQIAILRRAAQIIVVLTTAAGVLMTFPEVRHIGVSLFASAGVAGLILGLAARPILANLIAGIQIALTQPIRIEDVVIVEGEWGWIEEITATYVVVRIWDLRRLVVPLSYFIEKPFENWTRSSASLIGIVTWHLDYRAPIDAMRDRLREMLDGNPLWDGKVASIQVTETTPQVIQVRAIMGASNSSDAWNLRCDVRERMLTWLRETHPEALPRLRADISGADARDDPGRAVPAATG
jgi:small-conductance mechanosensitive channel